MDVRQSACGLGRSLARIRGLVAMTSRGSADGGRGDCLYRMLDSISGQTDPGTQLFIGSVAVNEIADGQLSSRQIVDPDAGPEAQIVEAIMGGEFLANDVCDPQASGRRSISRFRPRCSAQAR